MPPENRVPSSPCPEDDVSTFCVSPAQTGRRLDLFVVEAMEPAGLSRSAIQQLVRNGEVLVDGRFCKPGCRLTAGEVVTIRVPSAVPRELVPEKVSFQLLHEDDDLLVISKPPGVVVHPACGNWTGTLVHGLLFHAASLSSGDQRPGIVHRLDKETSGVMVVAKTDLSHLRLSRQFKDREVEKRYLTLVRGELEGRGRIVQPIGRHPVQRQKMSVLEGGGREAVTNWQVLERFRSFTWLEVRPETGRTHQIRVHLAAQGHSLAGDSVYGKPLSLEAELEISRQCLHASSLAFTHPVTGTRMQFTAPLWPDLERVVARLRAREGKERAAGPE